MMIEFKGISKRYKNGMVALNNIDLSIYKGEFVFLMGQSGAGKSTIIKMLTREEIPTTGQLYVNGKNIGEMQRKSVPKYRRGIGVVFQDFRLLPNKTVFENVAFAMRIIEAPHSAIKKRVMSVLHTVGLSSKVDSLPNQLSGGEQQRVAIARALVNNPPILICDEPTGNLDSQTASEIMDILERVNGRGTTIIMATHANDIVERMDKRVITLEKGAILEDKEQKRRVVANEN